MFTVRTQSLAVLPAGAAPLRILHLSDLHMLPWQRRKQEWVRELAQLQPHLVINTGDNLGHPEALPAVQRAVEPLLDVPGLFVFGSNDYFAPHPKNPASYLFRSSAPAQESVHRPDLPTRELRELLSSGRWVDLNNARAAVTVGATRISAVGLADPHIGMAAMPAPDLRGAESAADLHLGVTHAPYSRALDALQGDGCELLFAGHTHGGQLCVPGYGALVTNCDLDTARASGLHGWPGARPDEPGGKTSVWLNVSAGLGTSMYAPVRFACRPEVSLLQLVARPAAAE